MSDEKAARWVKQIEETIAGDDALSKGLRDEEAIPLVEWGRQRAQQIAARMAVPGAPEPDSEQVSNLAYALTRLMTRITWVVTHRDKKDAAWLTRTFHIMNDLSRELYGPGAPALSDDEIAQWIATHRQHSNGELVQTLIARFTPTATPPTPSTPDALRGKIEAAFAPDPNPPGAPDSVPDSSQGETNESQQTDSTV